MARKKSFERNHGQKAGRDYRMKQDTTSAQAVHLAIGRRLRSYYDQIVDQPIPDRFVDLLKQLEEKESGKKPR
jgi:hypothetical protein